MVNVNLKIETHGYAEVNKPYRVDLHYYSSNGSYHSLIINNSDKPVDVINMGECCAYNRRFKLSPRGLHALITACGAGTSTHETMIMKFPEPGVYTFTVLYNWVAPVCPPGVPIENCWKHKKTFTVTVIQSKQITNLRISGNHLTFTSNYSGKAKLTVDGSVSYITVKPGLNSVPLPRGRRICVDPT